MELATSSSSIWGSIRDNSTQNFGNNDLMNYACTKEDIADFCA